VHFSDLSSLPLIGVPSPAITRPASTQTTEGSLPELDEQPDDEEPQALAHRDESSNRDSNSNHESGSDLG
jgi:hypothetical protein